jgi:mRNA interferase RelE/StbE
VQAYSVCFQASVEKDLRRIASAARARCLDRIERLGVDPRPRSAIRLTGSQQTYRIRVASYRVVYRVYDEERLVEIQYVRHRKDAYR